MRFMIYATDKENGLPIRQANREAHLAFLKTPHDKVNLLTAGPWLSQEDGDMSGSLLIVEADSQSAVEDWLDEDPYFAAGLRGALKIHPFIWAIGGPENKS